MNVKLYTSYCPRCKILEEKLAAKKQISYKIEDNIDNMIAIGLTTAPVLEVDNKRMEYVEAIKYINSL